MSAREWKPGDVAMSRLGRVFAVEGPSRETVSWVYDDGSGGRDGSQVEPNSLRPLVVIDPEDDGQVSDLSRAYAEGGAGVVVRYMQAALRKFANPAPPKPEEPTGLGAVVEDSVGARWTLCAPQDDARWLLDKGGRVHWCAYSNITAVKVLSQGVTE